MNDIDALMDEVELSALVLFEEAGIEAVCNTFGNLLHALVCADDNIEDGVKAGHITLLIARHLTSVAIGHFDVDDLPARIETLMEADSKRGKLN